MTPEIAKKWLPIIQAVAEGKTLQMLVRSGEDQRGPSHWQDLTVDGLIAPPLPHCPDFYRIKPEPRKPREFWIVKEIDGPFIGVFGDGQLAGKVASGNRKIIHVREVIDE